MTVQSLLLASLLAVVPTLPAFSAEPEALEGLVVQMATTPGHHLALADYYRNKAVTARQEAQQHRSMARAYGRGKIANQIRMKSHCDEMVSSYEAIAKEYEGLAALHDEEASKKQ